MDLTTTDSIINLSHRLGTVERVVEFTGARQTIMHKPVQHDMTPSGAKQIKATVILARAAAAITLPTQELIDSISNW